MDKVNVIQHMNEIRNILSYATNIGFFFGAGTSCAFGLPNIMTLTSECRERLNETEKKLLDKVAKSVIDLSGKPQVSMIEMLHITKEFPGIKANDDITLQLRI